MLVLVGATTNYPLECFKVLSPKDRKQYGVPLCREASTPLPSTCWKTISTLPGLVRRVDPGDTLSFCRGVASTAQLECVRTGLKKERRSLSQAIAECQDVHEEVASSAAHEDPFEVVPPPPDDAVVEACVGRTKSAAPEWSSEEAEVLCSQAGSVEQVAAIVECAVDILKSRVLTALETGRVCRSAGLVEEQEHYSEAGAPSATAWTPPARGRVSSCVLRAFKEVTMSSSMRTAPDTDLVISACGSVRASASSTGTCIASFSNKKMQDTITPAALLELCTSRNGLSKLNCLKAQRNLRPSRSRGPATAEEVRTCTSLASRVHVLRATRVESATSGNKNNNNNQGIMAGRFFSLTFEMIDQVHEC
jgi:hypothetical protein